MKSLLQIYNEQKVGDWPDKNSTHSYVPVYENILAPYRNCSTMLEIGLFSGESLKMWYEYFEGEVYGIDCSETPHDGMADLRPMIQSGKYNIEILDATDKNQVDMVFGYMRFDVIIEDGPHDAESQIKIYNNFKDKLNPGSLYIIEDIENIDVSREMFHNIDPTKEVTILDRRHVKSRFDDVLIIITDKK